MYLWLLEHPDQALNAWRRLGAKGRDITDLGGGKFCWNDGLGTTIRWQTVHRDRRQRVWYAEGSTQPTRLVPSIPFRAVLVMHYCVTRDGEPPLLMHKADLFLQTDSRTAKLITRVLGSSAPGLAEQGLSQIELFFSALVGYLDRYPEHAAALRSAEF
jgi:hypothetical protein